ncbi:MAG: hypothetical protein H6962_08070 [Chromatiaceae bacterium]|nr:hypothetical protein [Chromatiaceae bacterium]
MNTANPGFFMARENASVSVEYLKSDKANCDGNPILRICGHRCDFGLAMRAWSTAQLEPTTGENSGGFLAGVWMLRYKVAVGQEYLEVLSCTRTELPNTPRAGWPTVEPIRSRPTIAFEALSVRG